jgi:hypothetical protein
MDVSRRGSARSEACEDPVIVMTAAGAERAATVEATYVVRKPLDLGKVVEIVERHCRTGRR